MPAEAGSIVIRIDVADRYRVPTFFGMQFAKMVTTMVNMELNSAKLALADQYKVTVDSLEFMGIWDASEVGKCFLMFLITDPNHCQHGSTVSFAISRDSTVPVTVTRFAASA